MAELKCPHCGQAFTVDDTELSSIVQQIRDKEFEKDLNARVNDLQKHLTEKHELEMEAQENEIRLSVKDAHEKEIQDLKDQLRAAEDKAKDLQSRIDANKDKTRIEVLEAVKKVEEEKHDLENALAKEKELGKALLTQKDEEIAFYKDMKARMSTKMVGESLEQHCEIQFNQLRPTAFKNAYFEKDNDARTGSKGDFIYRECDENGVEIISIMFEMKNEMDTTATKHKNEDFFKELDKDRREKDCEYAVLVSLLESDNELYNSGIVDVSYKYDKMYVVRPQCFIPIITILRNAALNALTYKQELAVARNQNIDITNFEDSLMQFKNDFSRNYELAHSHFDKAIEEIDKTIDHLQKVKKELTGSDKQLYLANKKVDDVTIKKLTKGNPTMQAKFDALKDAKEE
ncbi:MAG: DUF2130 domain-containing protein [Clostridiales bacterium]|nr:DUF2130 domain-containing protein [Clostridiales bacterium]